jgi:hypothetical protein
MTNTPWLLLDTETIGSTKLSADSLLKDNEHDQNPNHPRSRVINHVDQYRIHRSEHGRFFPGTTAPK